MSKKHMEENTQYVDEERRAPTEDERKAIANALAEMGEMEILGADAVLVGRQDEPYGWYLFDLGDCVGDGKGRYLILGDCLDVLPDYGKILTIKDVRDFALLEEDGRFAAIRDWGVPIEDADEDNVEGWVWVLTIMKDGQNFPEVHKTFKGAVASALNDFHQVIDDEDEDEDEIDFAKVEAELKDQRFWKDESRDLQYDIVDCLLCD